MRLPFVTICVAIAACRVGHAAPSSNSSKSPRPLLGVPAKRRLRSDKLAPDEEERIFDINLNLPLLGKEAQEPVPIMRITEKSMENEQATSREAWEQSFKSFGHKLEKGKIEVAKVFLSGQTIGKAKLFQTEDTNFRKLLKGWEVPVESIESESKSSAERLQDWVKAHESPDKLFKVLRIHKAADKAANSLLISFNLERWNLYMGFYDKTGPISFEEKLKIALNAYCGDENQVELFRERLGILRQKIDPAQLSWLHKGKHPKDVYGLMEFDNGRSDRFEREHLIKRSIYVDVFNDLYPEHQTTLIAAFPYTQGPLLVKVFDGITLYPQSGTSRRRMLDKILESWADSKTPVSPAGVFIHLGLLPHDIKGKSLILKVLENYVALINKGKPQQEKATYKNVLKSLENVGDLEKNLLKEKEMLQDPMEIQRIDDYLESLHPETPSKRKAESPPEGARDRQRPRGE